MSAIASGHLEEIFEIGAAMKRANLPDGFVADAVKTAMEFEGVYDLLVLWRDEAEQDEREEIIADIQELIEDCAQTEKPPPDPPPKIIIKEGVNRPERK
jgi:hypothetical protein